MERTENNLTGYIEGSVQIYPAKLTAFKAVLTQWESIALQNHFYFKYDKNTTIRIAVPKDIDKINYRFGTVRTAVEVRFISVTEGTSRSARLIRGSFSATATLALDDEKLPLQAQVSGAGTGVDMIVDLTNAKLQLSYTD